MNKIILECIERVDFEDFLSLVILIFLNYHLYCIMLNLYLYL